MELMHAACAVPANCSTAQIRRYAYMSFLTVDRRASPKATVCHSYKRDEAHKT